MEPICHCLSVHKQPVTVMWCEKRPLVSFLVTDLISYGFVMSLPIFWEYSIVPTNIWANMFTLSLEWSQIRSSDVPLKRVSRLDDQCRHAFDWVKWRGFFFKYSLDLKAHVISHSNFILTAKHGGSERWSAVCWQQLLFFLLNGKLSGFRAVNPYSSIGETVVFQMTVLLPFQRNASSIACTAQHTYIIVSMPTHTYYATSL